MRIIKKTAKGPTHQKSHRGFSGFTIIELMIATVIFSIILLICMQTITTIGRMFYKGVTLSRTGEAARSSMDTIENDLRFASGNSFFTTVAPASPMYYCIGDERYTYYPGVQVLDPSNSGNPSGLIRQQFSSFDACKAGGAVTGSQAQLLGSGMRITYFSILGASSGGGLYNIGIALANTVIGDNSALVDSEAGNAPANSSINSATAILCKQGLILNTQYCATVNLSTSVIMKGGYN